MSVIVFATPSGLFTSRLMYQSRVRSLSVIANWTRFVSSYMIFFASYIFSQMNTCFSGSSDASPRNYGNLIVGYCPTILNRVELLSSRSVDN